MLLFCRGVLRLVVLIVCWLALLQVKKVAQEKFNYTFGDTAVSSFVSGFYDAVVLYALALNDTVRLGGDLRDGREVTRRMWNRTFEGECTPCSNGFTVNFED